MLLIRYDTVRHCRLVTRFSNFFDMVLLSLEAWSIFLLLFLRKCSIQGLSIKCKIIVHLNNVSVRQLNEMCWFDEKDEVCFMLKSQIQGWTNQSAQFKVEANRSFCNFCVGWESTSRILFSFDLEHYKPVLERYVNSCYWYCLLEWLFLYRRVSLSSSDVHGIRPTFKTEVSYREFR